MFVLYHLFFLFSSFPSLWLLSSSSSYSTVLRCWCENVSKRPPFSELVMDIETTLEAIAGYIDFSCVSIMNTGSGGGAPVWSPGAKTQRHFDSQQLLLLITIHNNLGLLSCITSGSYLYGNCSYTYGTCIVCVETFRYLSLTSFIHLVGLYNKSYEIFYTILMILICCLFACSYILYLVCKIPWQTSH